MNLAIAAAVDWEHVYKAEWDYIVAMCWSFCRNHDLAKDLAQETFLQAWRCRGNFRGDAKVRTWLHRIAVNQCLTWMRRGKTRPMEVCAASLDVNGPPHIAAADPELKLTLIRAIAALPSGYRRVFIGHGVEGLGHMQVGERLGITQGCSKSQFTRAVRKLKRSLARRERVQLSHRIRLGSMVLPQGRDWQVCGPLQKEML